VVEPEYSDVIVVKGGICTITVPSWPSDGVAIVAVRSVEPEYSEVSVVNCCARPVLSVAMLEGTCTTIVPSCPSAGKARVDVTAEEPE
jgi:hypothetical protein